MKNNKGVTLVELLIVIVVMGIIAAFAIPAVGTIIENTQKDAILADALAVENAANLYCAQAAGGCASDEALTWAQVSPYVDGFDQSYYDLTANGGVVATKTANGWAVTLEAAGNATDADWEFTQSAVPSKSTRDAVIADTN